MTSREAGTDQRLAIIYDRASTEGKVEGDFGLLTFHIENIPSENPRTGRLTALSIIRSIQDAFDLVHIGT